MKSEKHPPWYRISVSPQKLRELRKESDLSASQLARQLGVSRQTISQWEKGITKPRSKMIEKLLKVCNVSVEKLTEDKKVHRIGFVGAHEEKNVETYKIIKEIATQRRIHIIRNPQEGVLEKLVEGRRDFKNHPLKVHIQLQKLFDQILKETVAHQFVAESSVIDILIESIYYDIRKESPLVFDALCQTIFSYTRNYTLLVYRPYSSESQNPEELDIIAQKIFPYVKCPIIQLGDDSSKWIKTVMAAVGETNNSR